MKFKTSIVLFLFCAVMYGQKPHVVLFDKAQNRVEHGFDIVEWVDLRPNKVDIGWAQKGLSNRRVPAVLEASVSEVFSKKFPPKNRKEKVAVRFRQLFVNELTKATTEFGFADVSVEVFLLKEGTYHFLETITNSTRVKSADVTRKHGQNILDAINGALSLVNSSMKSGLSLTSEQWGSKEPISLETDNAVILQEEPREGIFVTLTEFINNQPRDIKIQVEKKKNYIKIDEIQGTTERELLHGFAAAKNGILYIRFQEGFYELRLENNVFVFEGPTSVDANKVSTAALLGGAIGAGIVAASSKERWKYELDLSSGEKRPIKKLK